MKKENFECLYTFKYKNNEFAYLYAKNHPFYFLEYDKEKNTFFYPKIEMFIDLYSKFYSKDNIWLFEKNHTFLNYNSKIKNIRFKIIPLIRATSGLISISVALSMCGCKQTDNLNTKEETTAITTYDNSQSIYSYFQKYNMHVIDKLYDGNDYIFVKEFINSNEKRQITLQNFDEFKKFVGLNFMPTWEDVIKVFQSNQNIDDDKKQIILKGIDNMRNSSELDGIDLSVLYTNAKRMKLEYKSSEEMSNIFGKNNVYACFDSASGTVYLPSDQPFKTFEFLHEVLGHGTLAYRNETNESLVIFDCTNYIMLPTDNTFTGYSLGTMINEGGANMIAHIITQDYSVSSFYELYEEELRVIARLCNVSLGELLNHKGIDFYDLMYKNNINTPVEYIFKMDGILKGQLYCEFSDLMERLLVDATLEKVSNSNKNEQEQIIKDTVKIVKDSNFKDKEELNFEYNGGSINYNFEDTANNYENVMNQIKNGR